MFDPKTDRFPYPEQTDRHYLVVRKDRGLVFDKDYPYVDRRFRFRFVQALVRVLLYLIVFPAARIRLGLKVEGRQNLKKHRDVLRQGVVSCCNHVHMWDYIAVMCGVRPHRTNIMIWAPNVNGENGVMMRLVGGIPIPEGNVGGTKACLRAVHDLLDGGGWLHVYAEGSMWEYYAPIRPFKKGAATLAERNGKPLLPLAFSYREPGRLRRFFGQIATFTLHIGEPLFADESLPERERAEDLTRRAHAAVCRLAGFDPEENLYPPLYDPAVRRVDYYTDTYGVGYRGSR